MTNSLSPSPIKIGLMGASGSGKTTLAKAIEEKFPEIPYVELSTKPLWEAHGITSHMDILTRCVEDIQWGINFQQEVLDFRRTQTAGLDCYITDRTPLDAWAYFLMQCASFAPKMECQLYEANVINATHEFDFIFHLDALNILENDGMRVDNPFYQEYTDAVMKYCRQKYSKLAKHYEGKALTMTLPAWPIDARVYKVMQIIRDFKR